MTRQGTGTHAYRLHAAAAWAAALLAICLAAADPPRAACAADPPPPRAGAVRAASGADGAKAPQTAQKAQPATPAPAAAPAPRVAAAPAPAAPSVPETGHAGRVNASARVNAAIDNLIWTGMRLLDLPLVALVLIMAAVGGGLAMLIGRAFAAKGARTAAYSLLFLLATAMLGGLGWVFDRKVMDMRKELRELRSKADTDAVGLLEVLTEKTTKRKTHFFDPDRAARDVRAQFPRARIFPIIYDEAIDVVFIRSIDPQAQAYLAVVDLTRPGLTIRIDADFKTKRLTSDFARTNDCTLAMNGEAGASPGPDCGLGEWTGNMIREGRPVLLEDTAQRPFMSFNRANRATYSPAAVVDRDCTPERYNVIWGRWDALLEGKVAQPNNTDRQPRTVMAINAAGDRLYLLVVDGRQPDYSVGLSRAEAASIVKAFGGVNGMLCDEGGSACMFLKKFGGICNSPSDNRGRERPTYTHFGIRLPGTAKK